MSAAMLWVVCGAGRGVGKTHLAQQLCKLLPAALYAKQGCGQRRPDGPPEFFRSSAELDEFLSAQRGQHEHIVVESNRLAAGGRGDVIIFIDAPPGRPDRRSDAEHLRAQAHIEITPAATIRAWKRFLRTRLADNSLREAVCDCLMQHTRHLLGGRPEVNVKLWFTIGGMHVFGAGLARLLEHVERRGTLREAARAARISYRHAWGLVKNAEKHHGVSLLLPQPGGSGGGRSVLSDEGRRLLRAYRRIAERVDALAADCFHRGTATGDARGGRSDALLEYGVQLYPVDGAPPVQGKDQVAVEAPLTITIADVGSFTVMCTPLDIEALAVGFAFSEGLITDAHDVLDLKTSTPPLTVALRVDDPSRLIVRRNLIVTSSCGMCGQRNIDRLLEAAPACTDTLRVSATALTRAMEQMRGRQTLFRQTGGAHAAGLCTAEGELLVVCEDIGRHNALDKAIGQRLLGGQPRRGCAAVLSGRISFELVIKAARAGIELLAAVSAPSSLAIAAAERCHLTLCGFVRSGRATVYTQPQRITNLIEADLPR